MLRFRNYNPQTNLLEGMYLIEKSEPESITPYIQDKLKLLDPDQDNRDTDNPFRINPEMLDAKKVDFDLKRRLESKIEKLDRETRKNIDKYVKDQKCKKR